MAPPHLSAKAERERRLKAVLAFASELPQRVKESRDRSLHSDLEKHILTLPLPTSPTVTARQDELDRLGTTLWNLSTNLRRDSALTPSNIPNNVNNNAERKDDAAYRARTVCLLRVFAFLLLDTASGQATKAKDGKRKHCVRLLRVALKTARMCVEYGDLGSAGKVLETGAGYQAVLAAAGDEVEGEEEYEGEGEDGVILRVEYYMLRTTLSWKEKRMDVAEHMFTKSKGLAKALPPASIETYADLFYEMGKDFEGQLNYEQAIRWLERAHDIIDKENPEQMGPEASELRLSIIHTLAQVYMKLKTDEARDKAWDLLRVLEHDYGDKMAVQLLRVEMLTTMEPIDPSQVKNALSRLIRSMVLNETNFRTVMHYVHKIKYHSGQIAAQLLEDFMETRLYREESPTWIEKAVITRIWVATTYASSEDPIEPLHRFLDEVSRQTKQTLTAPGTHAAQTLMWKRVEAAYSQHDLRLAESWCRTCLHPLFEKAGELNQSKIARKIILCALSRQDYDAAWKAFSNMSATGRDEPITRYLMYKVALHNGNVDLSTECLDLVCKNSAKDATLLYACVLEAQSTGDKQRTLASLQKVLERYDYGAPSGVHLPALLRSTARILVKELKKEEVVPTVFGDLCKLFEGACTQAKASRRKPTTLQGQLFTALELEWFSKNSYNLALRYCASMHPENLLRLLEVCAEFIKLLMEEPFGQQDLPLRLMFCDFLASCALTTLARAEDKIHDCLQYYTLVQKHSEQLRHTASDLLRTANLSKTSQEDVKRKLIQVLKLEIEAALNLKDWDSLEGLFEECQKHDSSRHLDTLADLALVAHACMTKERADRRYRDRILKVLQKIIDLSCHQHSDDLNKVARWLRCLYQLSLDSDENISLKCLEKACQVAAGRHGVSPVLITPGLDAPALHTSPPSSSPENLAKWRHAEGRHADERSKERNRYPGTELEWLSTTSFNRSIDYYVQEMDDKCRLWAEKAMNLAQWADDGGALGKLLMAKYALLKWDP